MAVDPHGEGLDRGKSMRNATRQSARLGQTSVASAPRQTRSRTSAGFGGAEAQDEVYAEEEQMNEASQEEEGAPRAASAPASARYRPRKNAEIYKTGANAKGRQLWTEEERQVLHAALRRFARRKIKSPHALVYRDVLKAHGREGDGKLKRWNNVQLKDKARNELWRMRREGEVVSAALHELSSCMQIAHQRYLCAPPDTVLESSALSQPMGREEERQCADSTHFRLRRWDRRCRGVR